ncbi:uncharacterized protein LOC124538487 [Vanessa cardui]|uniref:uncharacterized protein LOC124538487 n=1 Tax=Vanessa cardui TaxID=171605 RepID=UPI001F12A3D2|nr:uncharacterized protein LOC124538487 [Vanessa cardui]
MQIFFILFITLMRYVVIGTTLEVDRSKRDSISTKNIVFGIFGVNANKPSSQIENRNENIFKIPKNDNFYERFLADLYYNDNKADKPLVQIHPLPMKFVARPQYPILFNKLSSKCCFERGNNLLNNNRLINHYVPKDAFLTTSKSVPFITNKGFFGRKDNATIVDSEVKKVISEPYLYDQSRIDKTNQEQSLFAPNQTHSDIKNENNNTAYDAEIGKSQQVGNLSQLTNIVNDDLKDIKMDEKAMTSSPTTYGQIDEVISTTDRRTVSVDIEENNQKYYKSPYYTTISEPVHSNNNINMYNTTEQSKINGSEMKNQKDSLQGRFETSDVWPQLYSSLTKMNTSIPLRAFKNVINDFMMSEFKTKDQSSKNKYVEGNLVKQRIIMNSDNFNDDNIAYFKNKLSLSNVATLDKPIAISSEKPVLDNSDDSEPLGKKSRKTLKERGDIPNF